MTIHPMILVEKARLSRGWAHTTLFSHQNTHDRPCGGLILMTRHPMICVALLQRSLNALQTTKPVLSHAHQNSQWTCYLCYAHVSCKYWVMQSICSRLLPCRLARTVQNMCWGQSRTQQKFLNLSLIHIWRCRRIERCRSRWSPYH